MKKFDSVVIITPATTRELIVVLEDRVKRLAAELADVQEDDLFAHATQEDLRAQIDEADGLVEHLEKRLEIAAEIARRVNAGGMMWREIQL